jgi:hypothetical protein
MKAYDMDPKPFPGQEVEVTYRAVWACWDPVNRPVTKPVLQPDTSRFLAPSDAVIRFVDENASAPTGRSVTLLFESDADAVQYAAYVTEGGGVCVDETCLGMDDVPISHLPAVIVPTEENA